MTKRRRQRQRRYREGSFTLIETVIGLSIMAFLIIEVSAVQGNAIYFSDYARNSMHASWLAKRIMSNVEYQWSTRSFKDMDYKAGPIEFREFPKYAGEESREPEYSYSLEIKEWKFPFVKLLTGGFGGGGEEEEGGEGEEGGLSQLIETGIKQVFGDEPKFMTAYVEVSWAEGAQRNKTSLTYLLTNQAKLDEAILGMKATYTKLTKPQGKKKNPPKPSPTPAPTPPKSDTP